MLVSWDALGVVAVHYPFAYTPMENIFLLGHSHSLRKKALSTLPVSKQQQTLRRTTLHSHTQRGVSLRLSDVSSFKQESDMLA